MRKNHKQKEAWKNATAALRLSNNYTTNCCLSIAAIRQKWKTEVTSSQ